MPRQPRQPHPQSSQRHSAPAAQKPGTPVSFKMTPARQPSTKGKKFMIDETQAVETPTQETAYPEWQAAIRKAQAEAREARAQREAKEAEEDANQKMKVAQQFVERLANAGITVKPEDVQFVGPTDCGLTGDPRVTIDGYEFTYIRRTASNVLSIAKRLPGNSEIDELDPEGHSSYSGVVHEIIDVYRGEIKAHEIADAIDHIESRVPDVLANNTRTLELLRKAKEAEKSLPVAKPQAHYLILSDKSDADLEDVMNGAYEDGYRFVSMSMSTADEDVVWTTVIMELQS